MSIYIRLSFFILLVFFVSGTASFRAGEVHDLSFNPESGGVDKSDSIKSVYTSDVPLWIVIDISVSEKDNRYSKKITAQIVGVYQQIFDFLSDIPAKDLKSGRVVERKYGRLSINLLKPKAGSEFQPVRFRLIFDSSRDCPVSSDVDNKASKEKIENVVKNQAGSEKKVNSVNRDYLRYELDPVLLMADKRVLLVDDENVKIYITLYLKCPEVQRKTE